MPELTDDQLDGLFRKSVEEFDTPFDPAAWQDMKARLDANDRTTPSGASNWKNLLRWGLPVALLLLLTGSSLFVYHKVKSGNKVIASKKITDSKSVLTSTAKGVSQAETPRLANTESAETKPARSSEQQVDEVEQLADRGETARGPGSSENRVDKSTAKVTELTSPERVSAIKRTETESLSSKSLNNPKAHVATKAVTSAYRQKETNNKPRTNRSRLAQKSLVTDNADILTNRLDQTASFENRSVLSNRKRRNTRQNSVAFPTEGYALSSTPSFKKRSVVKEQEPGTPDGASTENKVVAAESSETTTGVLPDINELASRPAHWPKSLTFTNRPVEAEPEPVSQQATPKLPPMRGLSVRFVVAPDLSTVGLKNFDRPGTNIGLLLEYRIASRWSIQAGVIKSTKVYKTLPSEYTAPSAWWQPPMKSPDMVDGRCNMFDIPINIRYDVAVIPRLDERRLPTRWFVSAGVTSYIMKQEDYTYTYPPHTYNQPTQWSTSTGGYGFSNLNLSVGYERSISRRLSWQVEPFMKAPLRGVGFFKVNLLSTGAFFSLRYKL
ncbi:hypothetical protein [Spirosoma foliorum]|uniref:Outer membrane protein beta-barrel domain-containing protein n=1 Tax=Spirosoma foliorum TaxID=2710596 RepID=A0A7G5GSF9_9BACT|nr:hypothetical protein [Spirosoma foliorum]QMW01801.1 hypothetical protein H3H32_28230 [Spirosoma foliorum]